MSASTTAVTSSTSAYTTPAFWERLWRTAGIQSVGLFIIGYVIYGYQPHIGASADALAAFYDGDRIGPERLRMGSLCVGFVPESHVDHVCGVWAMAGRADLERALRGGGRSRCACLAGRHHVAERWILGTRRRLFEVRLAHHRHRVGPGSEPCSLDPKSCYTCGMVRIPTECERRI